MKLSIARRYYPIIVIVYVALWLSIFTGCRTYARWQRAKQLERTAKDWNNTIRASQVIPVYPTTEDLQPGDIFLVTETVDNQHKAWKRRDFLKLDNHVARIQPSGYENFYKNSFLAGLETNGRRMPAYWLSPNNDNEAWNKAPIAHFPSYSFTTSSSLGASAAFPISGIPVGLSFLGSGNATVTVQIKDARTIGVDMISLFEDVTEWANENRYILSIYGPEDNKYKYIRAITRVYLTGKMTVTIQDSAAMNASASGGQPKPVDLLFAKEGITNFQRNIDAFNDHLAKQPNLVDSNGVTPSGTSTNGSLIPGGSVKLVTASSSSVTMDETFTRPVVLGYLAFDMAILEGGYVGAPIPTLAVVKDNVNPNTKIFSFGSNQLSVASFSLNIGSIIAKADIGDQESTTLLSDLDFFTQQINTDLNLGLGIDTSGKNINKLIPHIDPQYGDCDKRTVIIQKLKDNGLLYRVMNSGI